MDYFLNKKNIGALFFLIVGGFLLRTSYAERAVFFMEEGQMSPMLYPRILLWAWLILSIIYLLMPSPEQLQSSKDTFKKALPKLSLVLASIIIYAVMFTYVGLLVSTALFLCIFFYIMGFNNFKKSIPLALIIGVATWLIFEKLLQVTMPSNFVADAINSFTTAITGGLL